MSKDRKLPSHHYYRTLFRLEIEEAKDTFARCDCLIHRRQFGQYCYVSPEMLLFQQVICIVHGVHAWRHNAKVCFQSCLGSSQRHLNKTAVLNYNSSSQLELKTSTCLKIFIQYCYSNSNCQSGLCLPRLKRRSRANKLL